MAPRHYRRVGRDHDTYGTREEVRRPTTHLAACPLKYGHHYCSYPQLVGVRVCLGVAEAGLFPGVVY